ncbi:hypothetical protein S101395_03534 [Bacillus sonorensis]|uniref:YxeA family protein n=1 Tax=Bacillus sonorensis TaxID=119858 RepID=A0ABM6LLM9_9BACI|nr:hypothetical protein S101395_03534 [Bacillus sonorensis]
MKKCFKRFLFGFVIFCILGGVVAGLLEGKYKEGDELKLGSAIYGADTVENWKEAKNHGRFNIFDEDGVAIKSIPRHQRVKIIKLIKKDDMALVKMLDGAYQGTQWWVKTSELKKEKSAGSGGIHTHHKTSHSHHHH